VIKILRIVFAKNTILWMVIKLIMKNKHKLVIISLMEERKLSRILLILATVIKLLITSSKAKF
jgi:hypothetical protein